MQTEHSQPIQKHPRFRVHAPVDVLDASARVERLTVDNISLGGLFVVTPRAPLPGAALRIGLLDAARDSTLALTGRVVHVLQPEIAARKQKAPGMGVQFVGLTAQSEAGLRAFVDNLAREALAHAESGTGVHFVGTYTVVVKLGRALLGALYEQSLRFGGLFAEGTAPPLGAHVEVQIGPLRLAAEVVHVEPGRGAGLEVTDLAGAKRDVLQRMIEGRDVAAATPTQQTSGLSLGQVLGLARDLFSALERNDDAGAVGLTRDAGLPQVQARLRHLRRAFQLVPPEASPPQAARIGAALRALERIEPNLVQRATAIQRDDALVPQVGQTADPVAELVKQANAAERQGDRIDALRLLARLVALAPNDARLAERHAAMRARVDHDKAVDLIDGAAVLATGLGMRDEAIRRAREALGLSNDVVLRLRAAALLAKSGLALEAIEVVEREAQRHATDARVLAVLVQLYEKTHQPVLALRTAEALLRLKPDDDELKKRVRRLVKEARG